jgi:predicted Zn-dependent protease with MMP-like domain
MTGEETPAPQRAVRRDRRGRGIRGSLLPDDVPAARTRAEQFDDLVADAVLRVHQRLGDRMGDLVVAVDDVPLAGTEDVVLHRTEPAGAGHGPRLVVHRRPIESRAGGLRAREDLVLEVVVDGIADLLGLPVDDVDPDSDEEPPGLTE